MKKIHDSLSSKFTWYRTWHQMPNHSLLHFVILVVFIVGFSSVTLKAFSATLGQGVNTARFATAENLAKDNGMLLLKNTEVAFFKNEKSSSDGSKKMLATVGGIELSINGGSTMSFLQGSDMMNILVPKGDSAISTLSIEDFDGYEDGKIDKAIHRKFLKKSSDTIPVIVHVKTDFDKFYDKNDDVAKRNSKNNKFKEKRTQLENIISSNGKVKSDLNIIKSFSADINAKALQSLQKSDLVDKIDFDRKAQVFLDTSVAQINAPSVYNFIDNNGLTVTGNGIRVAVIDTGVDYTHPDLGGCFGPNCKVIGGYDFISNDSDPMDDQGHGTHVAATIAGNGLLKGVAYDAKILAYKVCASYGCPGSAIISAIQRAVDPNQDGNPVDHADIISMSLGGDGNPDDSMSTAVDNATLNGIVSVIAGGNSGPTASTIGSPGTARTAITVAASCKTAQIGSLSYCADPIASFSSRGPLIYNGVDIQKPDVSAPGVLICAARWASAFSGAPTCFDNQHIRISGTSMATPHVAGAVALMKQANPSLTPALIKSQLKSSAKNLGMSYNDQGAGEINVQTAVPSVTRLTISPTSWESATTPTSSSTVINKTFSVTPISGITTTALSVSTPTLPTGVTFVPSATTITFPTQNTTVSLGATLTVDNNIAIPGKYQINILLKENTATKGVIPIFLTITPTISLSVSDIDYGVNNPLLNTWTSQNIPIVITNKRADISQTVSISNSTFVSGITFTKSATSVTIPAGQSATIITTMSANNATVTNGVYTGSITISNSTNNVLVPIKFTKYHVLTIVDPNASTDLNLGGVAFLNLFDHSNTLLTGSISSSSNSKTFLLNSPGPWDVIFRYPFSGLNVFKENIMIQNGQSTITVQGSDAVFEVKKDGRDPDGVHIPITYIKEILEYPGTNLSLWSLTSANGDIATRHYSAVSSNYLLQNLFISQQPSANAYAFFEKFNGISSNNNTPINFSSLNLLNIKHSVNKTTGTISPMIRECAVYKYACAFSYSNQSITNLLSVPVTQHFYFESNLSSVVDSWFNVISDLNRAGCSSGLVCDYMYMSPSFSLATAKQRSVNNLAETTVVPSYAGNTIYNGLGPTFWNAKFNNTSTIVTLNPFSGSNSSYFPTALMRQDYSIGEESSNVPYQILSGSSVISSGNLPLFSASFDSMTSTDALFSKTVSTAGSYTFNSNFTYKIQNQSMNGLVNATFNTSLSDKNPPTITKLYFSSNSCRSERYNSLYTSTINTIFDPVGGSISSATASYATDIDSNFSPLTMSGSGTTYSIAIPASITGSKLKIKLFVTDNASNTFTYTFEVPIVSTVVSTCDGQDGPTTPDATPPTATITSPIAGTTISGIVPIIGTATDNVGIYNLKLYRGAFLLRTCTSSPCSYDVDTTMLANGAYSFTAVATDTSNNVTTSTVISVTVSNSSAPAPIVTINSPTTGATVSGTITISGTASTTSTSGLNSMGYYIDSLSNQSIWNGSLTGISSPFSKTIDTTTLTNGNHTIYVKVYDNQPLHLTTVASVAVVVNNTGSTTPDNTPPSAPANLTSPSKTDTSVILSWTASTDNVGVAGYDIYKNNTKVDSTTTATSYTATGLTGSVTYSFYIKAKDVAGNTSLASNTISVTTNETQAPDTTPPTAPTNLTAPSKTSTSIAISWTASTDNIGVAGYDIYKNSTKVDSTTTATSYTATGLLADTTYTFYVKAKDLAGNVSSASNTLSVITNTSPVSDTTSPVVSALTITPTPAIDGLIAKGNTYTISGTVTDNIALNYYQIFVNNSQLSCSNNSFAGQPTSGSFSCNWKVPKGVAKTFNISAKVYDTSTNSGTSAILIVHS
jgi:subtilisin family serine protease/chitodextrinase